MKSLQQAAILLLGMGEAQAAQVLRYMDQEQVEKIVKAMNDLGDVGQTEVQHAMYEFMGASAKLTGMGVSNTQYIKNTLINALGREKADSVLDKTIVDSSEGLEVMKWQSPKTIFDLIHREHNQLIAVMMTMIGDDKAAEVMKSFTDVMRKDIVARIAKLGPLSPIALSTINEVLVKLTSQLSTFKELPIGGAKKVADIVNYLGSEAEEEILASLAEIDEELIGKVQDFMFPFEKIAQIESRSLQKLLREVPTEKLTLAIKAADETIKAKFFENMSSRAADMIKDDLEAMGPIPLSNVIEAQKEIVAIAQKMGKEGTIVIGGAGAEQMV